MSDSEIRQLFKIIDEDGSGTIDIGEMTEFIWGEGAGHVMGSLEAAMDIAHRACDADHAGDVVEAIRSYEGAASALRHYGEDTAVRPTPHGSCVYQTLMWLCPSVMRSILDSVQWVQSVGPGVSTMRTHLISAAL